ALTSTTHHVITSLLRPSYTTTSLFLLLIPPPPTPTLFPYTTLFRSHTVCPAGHCCAAAKFAPTPSTTAITTPCVFMRPRRHYTRSEEHTSELQSQSNLVCRLLLEKKKKNKKK